MLYYLFGKKNDKDKKQKLSVEDEQKEYYKQLEIDVMARTIFGEARGEPLEGQEAVACVILNRVKIAQVKGRYWWGNNIIGVCQKPYQFSCWNKNDPSYKRLTSVTNKDKNFQIALRVATDAVEEKLWDCTNGATHYHADYVSPFWIKGEKPVKKIGRHIFYKLVEI